MSAEQSLEEQLAAFERAYDVLQQFMSTIPQTLRTEPGACGDWPPQDVLAHLCGWAAEAKRRFKRFPHGTGEAQYNRETFNKVSLWQREGHTWEALTAELQQTTGELAQMVRDLNEMQRSRFGERYREWLVGLTLEATDHQAELANWLDAQKHTR